MDINNKIIIGNWKMHKTVDEARSYMEEFNYWYDKNQQYILKNIKSGFAVPAIDIAVVSKDNKFNTWVGGQNIFYKLKGAYTGELSVPMVKSAGANFVLVGHSERRANFNETNEDVAKKVKVILENNLIAVICIGETQKEHESNQTKQIIKKGIEIILNGVSNLDNIIIAYEPIWAIGSGQTATPENAQVICKYIRGLLSNPNVPIQYGGSVKPENIAEFLNQPDINGVLVGGASLDPHSMVKLLTMNRGV